MRNRFTSLSLVVVDDGCGTSEERLHRVEVGIHAEPVLGLPAVFLLALWGSDPTHVPEQLVVPVQEQLVPERSGVRPGRNANEPPKIQLPREAERERKEATLGEMTEVSGSGKGRKFRDE
jgi:hypothetical protein